MVGVAIANDSLDEGDNGRNEIRNASQECRRNHVEKTHVGEKSTVGGCMLGGSLLGSRWYFKKGYDKKSPLTI